MHKQQLYTFLNRNAYIDPSSYIASSAELIGDVRVQAHASIWSQVVARADLNFIEIGQGTNIQEGCVLHLADDFPVIIGKGVTVGHKAMLHACTIEDNCLIGMQATLLDGAIIGQGSIVGACALVTQGTIIPPRSMVLGIPAKVIRTITDIEYSAILESAKKYIALAQAHKACQLNKATHT